MGWMIGLQMGLETALFSVTGIMIGWLGSIALAAHQVMVAISIPGILNLLRCRRSSIRTRKQLFRTWRLSPCPPTQPWRVFI